VLSGEDEENYDRNHKGPGSYLNQPLLDFMSHVEEYYYTDKMEEIVSLT
jgi:hypothetical protein